VDVNRWQVFSMQKKLTQKQENFLSYLELQIREKGVAPSLREAAKDLRISHAAVAQFVKALEEKGHIKREGRYSRNISVLNSMKQVEARQRWREVPVIGKVTAGMPIYAQQEWEGTVVVDGDVFRGQTLFALRIKGHSMKDAGILQDDLVICEPRQYAVNGEIVVALINYEEATVKRFFLYHDYIELQPDNSDYTPQKYKFSEILIQGKVMGVVRGPSQF